MTKLNKYISDSYQNFFDKDLSTTDPDLFNSIKLEQQYIVFIACFEFTIVHLLIPIYVQV